MDDLNKLKLPGGSVTKIAYAGEYDCWSTIKRISITSNVLHVLLSFFFLQIATSGVTIPIRLFSKVAGTCLCGKASLEHLVREAVGKRQFVALV